MGCHNNFGASESVQKSGKLDAKGGCNHHKSGTLRHGEYGETSSTPMLIQEGTSGMPCGT